MEYSYGILLSNTPVEYSCRRLPYIYINIKIYINNEKSSRGVFDRSIQEEYSTGALDTSIQQESSIKSYNYSFKRVLREVTCSKEDTLDFLRSQNVFQKDVLCPGPCFGNSRPLYCGRPMLIKKTNDNKDKYMWRCRKVHKYSTGESTRVCKDVKLSIRHQSWLVDTKITLETVVELTYLWSQGFTVNEILHELKLSKRTVIEWSAFFRETCFTTMMEYSEPIGGAGIEVEIDESKFGKRKYHKGHRVEGQWVFGGREKKDKSKIFMVPVRNRKKVTLLALIKRWIKPGSIIHSDCWKAYTDISKHGYSHVTVNHSKEFLNKDTGACTNAIESDWRHAKVSIPPYGIHKGLHAGYLGEFMWRRRNYNKDKFLELLKDINFTFERKYLQKLPSSS